jgi:hypothetical protein
VTSVKQSHIVAQNLAGGLTTSPVTPDGWEHFQLPNSGAHVLDFDLGVFRSCLSLC